VTQEVPSIDATAVLSELWKQVDGDSTALERVTLTGADPILPTDFKIGTAASAAIAATALADMGKLSATLDLHRADDTERLRQLIRQADVFSQGYRPGALARYGFSPEDVARIRPGIVYVSLSAYSHTGPWKERRGAAAISCASRSPRRDGPLGRRARSRGRSAHA
jgi:hypothetical protein